MYDDDSDDITAGTYKTLRGGTAQSV